METQLWKLEDAKAQFSHVVESALRGRAQHVTRRGKPAVVVLAETEYQALQRSQAVQAPSFVEHLLAMPKSQTKLQSKPQESRKATSKAPETRAKLALREVDFS
jgi:antitoxin Phd